MSQSDDIERVVTALKRVPPKHLLIIDLANSIPLIGGQPDIKIIKEKQKDITLAAAEAKAYGAATIQAVLALVQMKSIN